MTRLFRFPFACLAVSWTVWAQQSVIEISGANFRPLPLAIAPPLAPQDKHAAPAVHVFDSTLLYDFRACGLFQVLDRKGFLAPKKEGMERDKIAFKRWSDVGAEALLKTQLALKAGQLHSTLSLFSVASGRRELHLTLDAAPARPQQARQLAHKLAQAVYHFYTQETGPFLTRIAYTFKSPRGRNVYIADWDGKNARSVTRRGVNVLPALIPNGVAFTSYRRQKPHLFVAIDGGTPALLVGKGAMVTGVAYSRDKKRLAVSITQGENAEIYVANADGTQLKRVTHTKFFLSTSPSWAPSGDKIAFVSNRGGSPQIYVMRADGTKVRRLTFQGKYNTTPAWSPSGDTVAFTARDEFNAFDIFTVAVETGKVTRLTQGAGNNEEPVYSPSGRLMLFTSTRSGKRHLYVMTANGDNQVPLPMPKGDYATPDW